MVRKSHIIIALVFFLFLSYIYFTHLARDIYSGDIGDLATAAYTFGVPHPPGYPTLTLLGFLFSKIPLSIPIITKISLVSVVASLIGLAVYYHYACKIFSTDKKTKQLGTIPNAIMAILSTSMVAFSYLFWLYTEVFEVFALSNALLICIYCISIRYFLTRKLVYAYITTFLIGLSLTNQQSIIATFSGPVLLLLPGLIEIIKKKKVTAKAKIMQLLRVFFAGVVGLSLYIYVFISASTNPQINWLGSPTIENFIRLILRMNYEFATNLISVSQRIVILNIYNSALIDNISILGVFLCLVGVIYTFRHYRWLAISLISGFLLSGPIFIFIIAPEIRDADQLGVIERFFMHSFVILMLLIPFGLTGLFGFFSRLNAKPVVAFTLLLPLFFIPIQMMRYNSPKINLSQTIIGSNLAYDILKPLPRNAVILLKSDSPTFNSWYVKYVLSFRQDISLISGAGDRNDLLKKLSGDFVRQHPQLDDKKETILAYMLPELFKKRPVFSMAPYTLRSKEVTWIPRGLAYELVYVKKLPNNDEYKKIAQSDVQKMHLPFRDELAMYDQNIITPNISRIYASALLSIGDHFYLAYNNRQEALVYYNLSQKVDPYNSAVYAKKGIVQARSQEMCSEAIENIETAIQLYRFHEPYYKFAHDIFKRCQTNDWRIQDLKEKYRVTFGKTLHL